MTATATAGLRSLYNRITPACPTDEADAAVAGVTNVEGFFDPTHPVPLLGTRYQYVKKIGRGTFAVIIMATDMFDPERRLVAIKVMHAQYIEIGMQEARRIRNINAKDVHDVAHIVRCFNCFTCGRHYCIVFELMSMSPIRHCIDHATTSVGGSGGSRARSAVQRRTNAVRKVAAQLMAALSLLRRAAVIHADIKPENILLRDNDATNCSIKLADFGNAMQATEEETSAYYGTFELQSLWYRAPEVILGLPFGPAIDVWSAGCVLAELYLGAPMFAGNDNDAVLAQIVGTLGPLPRKPFARGARAEMYGDAIASNTDGARGAWSRDSALKRLMSKLGTKDTGFAGFILELLAYSPEERLAPHKALRHPFMAHLFPFNLVFDDDRLLSDAAKRSVSPADESPEAVEHRGFVTVQRATPTASTLHSVAAPAEKVWWLHATATHLPDSPPAAAVTQVAPSPSPPPPPSGRAFTVSTAVDDSSEGFAGGGDADAVPTPLQRRGGRALPSAPAVLIKEHGKKSKSSMPSTRKTPVKKGAAPSSARTVVQPIPRAKPPAAHKDPPKRSSTSESAASSMTGPRPSAARKKNVAPARKKCKKESPAATPKRKGKEAAAAALAPCARAVGSNLNRNPGTTPRQPIAARLKSMFDFDETAPGHGDQHLGQAAVVASASSCAPEASVAAQWTPQLPRPPSDVSRVLRGTPKRTLPDSARYVVRAERSGLVGEADDPTGRAPTAKRRRGLPRKTSEAHGRHASRPPHVRRPPAPNIPTSSGGRDSDDESAARATFGLDPMDSGVPSTCNRDREPDGHVSPDQDEDEDAADARAMFGVSPEKVKGTVKSDESRPRPPSTNQPQSPLHAEFEICDVESEDENDEDAEDDAEDEDDEGECGDEDEEEDGGGGVSTEDEDILLS
eukprot:m.178007 g.178007  ORF g.178007 m.178007 type:complete len:908 (+) comp24503_c0_seq11:47-2770(+)